MILYVGQKDISKLVSTIKCSGSNNNCARTLSAEILQPPYDNSIERLGLDIGLTVTYKADGMEFYGVVFDISKSTENNKVILTAYDMCIYAKKTKIYFKANKTTPEAMAAAILREHGLPYGTLTETAYRFSHKFLGNTIFDAIMTGYGYASAEIGDKYIMRADKMNICVYPQGKYIAGIIKPKQNLIDATYKLSATNAVNRVEIRDDNGKLLQVLEDDDKSYGVAVEIIKKSKKSDTSLFAAKKALENGKIAKTATVTIFGNPECITGNAVIIKEPYTGMYGLFFIEGDTHTWSEGTYTTKLNLNYRNVMSKADLPDSDDYASSKTGSGLTGKEMTWITPNGEELKWYD